MALHIVQLPLQALFEPLLELAGFFAELSCNSNTHILKPFLHGEGLDEMRESSGTQWEETCAGGKIQNKKGCPEAA
jgi:hypothetical protein